MTYSFFTKEEPSQLYDKPKKKKKNQQKFYTTADEGKAKEQWDKARELCKKFIAEFDKGRDYAPNGFTNSSQYDIVSRVVDAIEELRETLLDYSADEIYKDADWEN